MSSFDQNPGRQVMMQALRDAYDLHNQLRNEGFNAAEISETLSRYSVRP